MLETLSTFGSVPVLLLLSLLMACWLAYAAGMRAALAWCAALLVCVGLLALLKVYFRGCPRPELGLLSPSGHAGFSLFVYGGIALCVARDEVPWRRLVLPAAGLLWIAAIAWSRYALHAHSPSEIVFGLLAGGLVLAAFALGAGPLPRIRFPFALSVLIAALLTLAMIRLHWNYNFEELFRHIGREWRPWLPLCSRH